MKKTMRFALGAALGVLMLAGAPTAAFAQNDVNSQIIGSLEFQSTDVREALRALFKNVGVSYTIAPEVQGTVTVSLKNVPFETALQNVTRQVDATYRIEGGVYQIVRREETGVNTNVTQGDVPQVTPGGNKVRRRIKIRYADPQFIAILMGPQSGSQNFSLTPEISTLQNSGGGMMGGMGGGMMGGMGGGMGGGMMGGMGGGMMGGMGGGMMGGMGGGMGGMGGGMMGGMGGGMGGGFGR